MQPWVPSSSTTSVTKSGSTCRTPPSATPSGSSTCAACLQRLPARELHCMRGTALPSESWRGLPPAESFHSPSLPPPCALCRTHPAAVASCADAPAVRPTCCIPPSPGASGVLTSTIASASPFPAVFASPSTCHRPLPSLLPLLLLDAASDLPPCSTFYCRRYEVNADPAVSKLPGRRVAFSQPDQ